MTRITLNGVAIQGNQLHVAGDDTEDAVTFITTDAAADGPGIDETFGILVHGRKWLWAGKFIGTDSSGKPMFQVVRIAGKKLAPLTGPEILDSDTLSVTITNGPDQSNTVPVQSDVVP